MMPLLRERKDLIEIHRKDPNIRCEKYDVVLYKRGNIRYNGSERAGPTIYIIMPSWICTYYITAVKNTQ